MESGGNNQKRSVTRRKFLEVSGVAAGAAGAAPILSAPFVSRALADNTSLSIVQWSHFVPEYDTWFDKFAKDWGEKNKIAVTVDHVPVQNVPARAAAEASAQSGHDLFGFNGAGGAHLYRKFFIDVSDLVKETEKKYGKVSTIGRHLVSVPRFLHQLPGHVSKKPVGRDRDEARHMGQSAHWRRQA
jgi:multiple sugar transport system substrate-binding protein